MSWLPSYQYRVLRSICRTMLFALFGRSFNNLEAKIDSYYFGCFIKKRAQDNDNIPWLLLSWRKNHFRGNASLHYQYVGNRRPWLSLWHAIRRLIFGIFRVSFNWKRKYATPIHWLSFNFLRSILSKDFIESLGTSNPTLSFLTLLSSITIAYLCLFDNVCICLARDWPRESDWLLTFNFSHMWFLEKIPVICQYPGEGIHGVNGLSLLWSF